MSYPEVNRCCFCGDECNPHSQSCGQCMRRTSMMDPRDITYHQEGNRTPSPIVVSVDELIVQLKTLTDKQRLEIISLFCSSCGTVQPTKGCQCWNDG